MPKSVILRIISAFGAFWLDADSLRVIPVVSGGDGPVDPAAGGDIEIPTDFQGLDEADLRDLHGRLETKYNELRADATTKAQVNALRVYREAQTRIVAEIERQTAERAEVAEALTGLDTPPVLPEAKGPEDEDEDEDKPVEGEPPAEPDAPATPEAIAAAMTAADIAAGRTPQTAAEQAPEPSNRPQVVMTAAASQQVVPFGQAVTLAQIGEIVNGVKGGMRTKNEVVRAFVASVPAYEEMPGLGIEILSSRNAVSRNDELIHEAVEAHQARRAERMGRPAPRTAAICEPLDIIREIPDYVSQADPLTSSLPSRPISRLGFTFTPGIALGDVSAGVQAGWDDADQASVDPTDPETWKPCYDVTCGSPCEITANAATACMTFDITTEMSSPERVRDIMNHLTALRIRTRTIQLLDVMDSLSIQWTQTGEYSLLPDTIRAIGLVLPRLTYDERLDEQDYTLYLPPGFAESLVIDKNGKEFADSAELQQQADAAANTLGALFGMDVVRLRDETDTLFDALPAVATPTALDDGPSAWPLRLIHTPSALYGSTGLVDTGIQSDPQLTRQNKRQWFQEEFTLLTKHGSPPWAKITLTSAASGSRAAASTKLTCS